MIELKEYYETKEEAVKSLEEYNKGRPEKERKYYVYIFNDYTNKKMYIVCDRDTFFFYRNEQRNEKRKKDRESRCLIPSDDSFRFKKCMYDCSNCPFGKYERDGKPLSLDYTYLNANGESFEIEIEDDSPSVVDKLFQKERIKFAKQLLNGLSEKDKKILILYYLYSKTDKEISAELNIPKTTVCSRRERLIQILQEKSKKFYD